MPRQTDRQSVSELSGWRKQQRFIPQERMSGEEEKDPGNTPTCKNWEEEEDMEKETRKGSEEPER